MSKVYVVPLDILLFILVQANAGDSKSVISVNALEQRVQARSWRYVSVYY